MNSTSNRAGVVNLGTSLPLEQTSNHSCPLEMHFLTTEMYCYLFVMCPLAFVGIVLNLISLKCFLDKSFNSVTFKYLRLITLTDFFICIIIIPYCILFYTQPFNKYDLYARNLYVAFLYMPGANVAINVAMLLNLLVTIERLISVGWPTLKYTLFKPSRYYISVLFVILISLLSNMPNFFLYKVTLCQPIMPREFVSARWWTVFGYVRETLTRILPILLLILFNTVLIYIVKTSRKKMKSSVNIINTNRRKSDTSANNSLRVDTATSSNNGGGLSTSHIHSPEISLLLKNQASKRNRQENQLTWMSIVVGILYSATSLPMVFAYPGLIFSVQQIQTDYYKIYALLVNILELIQCSVVRFLIYFCFTTQFREVFYKMLGFKRKKPSVELVTYAENA